MDLKGAGGESVKLTDEEYEQYNIWHQQAKQHMGRIIGTAQYQRLPDSMKAKLLRSVYDKYRSAANKRIVAMVRKRTSVGS